MELVKFFSLFFSLFFQWIKKFFIWSILKVCLGKLNVFLSLYFFCCSFKRTEQAPVQSNKMTPSALISGLRSVNGWALMLKWVPGHSLLGLQILGQQSITLCVCAFQLYYGHKGNCNLSICLHSGGEKLAWLNQWRRWRKIAVGLKWGVCFSQQYFTNWNVS